jgi:hypothetical protein
MKSTTSSTACGTPSSASIGSSHRISGRPARADSIERYVPVADGRRRDAPQGSDPASRQTDGKRAALPFHAIDLNRSTVERDNLFHHVEAHAHAIDRRIDITGAEEAAKEVRTV